MNKKLITMTTTMIFAISAVAQKIDFDMANRQPSEVTTDGYTSWMVAQGTTDSKTVDGITITISASGNANMLRSQWSKNDVKTRGLKLTGDGVAAFISDNGNTPNITDKSVAITLTVAGLPSGRHTLQAYHNGVNGYSHLAPLSIRVNGQLVKRGVKQSENASTQEKAAQSYISFDAEDGKNTVITYASEVTEGETFGSSLVYLNALIFDQAYTATQAQSPSPADGDSHFDADNGFVTLSWTAPSGTVKHHLIVGTQPDNMVEVDATSDATYTMTGVSSLNQYYWRVDEEDGAGHITEGTVWSFRTRRLAFPEAQGYGKYAIGGRGGDVYHVTTLEDNGDDNNPTPGSLRYGIKKASGPRTIVFDVGGVISLKNRLTCSEPYVTIAGQTAPGKGIMLSTCPFGMGSDGITRFIRMRLGHKKLVNGVIPGNRNGGSYGSEAGTTAETTVNGLDGMGMAGNDHAIMDHCSISWTIDEAFSSRNAKNLTLQHTLISEALNVAGHPNYDAGTAHGYAATIGGGEMSSQLAVGSYHHNLLAHCEGRNWSISGGLDGKGNYDGHHDIFNNVVYNWGGRASDGGSHQINFVNNYYKKGPATSQNYLMRLQIEGTGTGTQSAYIHGNIRQERGHGNITEDQRGNTYRCEISSGQVVVWNPLADQPFFDSKADIETARAAYKNVLCDVGCTLPVTDNHDRRMISETLTGTASTQGSRSGKPGLIDSEEDTGCEGFSGLDINTAIREEGYDTDGDGMPDWWEEANRLNPTMADNNDDDDGDGYTNLENFLNWMAEPHFIINGRGKQPIDLKAYFAGYTNKPRYEIKPNSRITIDYTDASAPVFSAAKGFSGFTTVRIKATDEDGWGELERSFNFYFRNTTNGIVEIESAASAQRNHKDKWFNLQGQRVTRPTKGIFIHNGKKEIVR